MPDRKINRKLKLPPTDSIISVILVTQNDEDLIEDRLLAIYRELKKIKRNFEILIIDNGSNDQTIEKIKNLKKVIKFSRILVLSKKHDPEVALTAGLDSCIGDFAILFNHYIDPPEIKHKLLEKLLQGYDIVIGKNKKSFSNLSNLSRWLITAAEKLSRQGFIYRESFLMALNRKAINSITRTRRKSRNFSYLHSLIGFKKEVIEYQPLRDFQHKIKKIGFFDLFFDIADIIISNSFRPIRFLSFSGMVLSALYLFYVLVIAILYVVFNMKWIAPQGWFSVSAVVGTLFFLLFSLLSLMSEYMIRILNETRNEPFYFIAEEIDRSTIIPKRKALNVT